MILNELQEVDSEIITKLKELEESCQARGRELLMLRFEQGIIFNGIINNTKYGEGALVKASQSIGMTARYANQLSTIAGYFNCNKKAFLHDVNKQECATITYYLKEFANPNDNAKAVGGKKEHEQILLQEFEKGLAAYETLKEKYPNSEEAKGVEAQFVDIVSEDAKESDAEFFMGNPQHAAPIGVFAGEDGQRIEDEEYCEWLRSQPCCITGAYGAIEVNHIRQKGRDRSNASDYLALPFIKELHTGNPKSFHRMQFDEFEKHWTKQTGKEINLRKFVLQHIAKYIIHLRSLAKF